MGPVQVPGAIGTTSGAGAHVFQEALIKKVSTGPVAAATLFCAAAGAAMPRDLLGEPATANRARRAR